MDSGHPPSRVGVVHDVIMDECKRVEDLYGKRAGHGLWSFHTKSLRRCQKQNRSQPFPFSGQCVADRAVQRFRSTIRDRFSKRNMYVVTQAIQVTFVIHLVIRR
jgi:hypothetical protein